MTPEVALRIAEPHEADVLAGISRRSFDSDLAIGAPGSGGPPGYDDPSWQRRMMRAGDYYCILVDGTPAGGAIVHGAGDDEWELGRIFLDPEWHRRGIGTLVMTLVMERYPGARRWILDTPDWNPRTRAFYEALGFTAYGTVVLDAGFSLVLYEKQVDRLF
ncbi:MAG: GNAT family N-acetyltransferase [Acidimicrobiia bacterium]|nr:GNAT family N-acetyltransferase [Acidimicrobiia bacterium]